MQTTKRHHAKVLKTVLSMKKPFCDTIYVSKELYNKCNLSDQHIEESLNALASENVIELIQYGDNGSPTIKLLQSAYAYFPNKRSNNFRFWIPVCISILALIISILALLKP